MKKIFFGIIFVWLTLLNAQPPYNAIVRGQILLADSAEIPIENIQITAPGANPTRSNSFGSFVLEFDNKKPGEEINISVLEENYEVINQEQLKVTLSLNPDALHKIVLCLKGRRDEATLNHYKIDLKSFKRTLESKIENQRNQIDTLNNKFDEFKNQLEYVNQVIERLNTKISIKEIKDSIPILISIRFPENYPYLSLNNAVYIEMLKIMQKIYGLKIKSSINAIKDTMFQLIIEDKIDLSKFKNELIGMFAKIGYTLIPSITLESKLELTLMPITMEVIGRMPVTEANNIPHILLKNSYDNKIKIGQIIQINDEGNKKDIANYNYLIFASSQNIYELKSYILHKLINNDIRCETVQINPNTISLKYFKKEPHVTSHVILGTAAAGGACILIYGYVKANNNFKLFEKAQTKSEMIKYENQVDKFKTYYIIPGFIITGSFIITDALCIITKKTIFNRLKKEYNTNVSVWYQKNKDNKIDLTFYCNF